MGTIQGTFSEAPAICCSWETNVEIVEKRDRFDRVGVGGVIVVTGGGGCCCEGKGYSLPKDTCTIASRDAPPPEEWH